MGSKLGTTAVVLALLAAAAGAQAQPGRLGSSHAWRDPKLIAGQVGFNVALSFFGKLIVQRESPGRALKQALVEGTASGLMAHAGYSIAGDHPRWALLGKTLAQKSTLTTRRSIQGRPVFDETLYRHWELTYTFVHFKLEERPRVEIDAVNAAFSGYYLLSGDPYRLDGQRSLLSGSLVFQHQNAPTGVRGFYVPGNIWVDADHEPQAIDTILAHEVIHSLQAERGAAIDEWHFGPLRLNWLVFASGVPAFLSGWPEHDARLHEREADAYSGTD